MLENSGFENKGDTGAEVAPVDFVKLLEIKNEENIKAAIESLKELYDTDPTNPEYHENRKIVEETSKLISKNDPDLANRIKKEVMGKEVFE